MKLAARLVRRPLRKAYVLLRRGCGFGDQQRAPEAVFDLLANIVANSLFIERAQIRGKRGIYHIGHSAHGGPRPIARLFLAVVCHDSDLRRRSSARSMMPPDAAGA